MPTDSPTSPALVREITNWFASHGRPLPWREKNPGAWGILVVEVMSQQTPIERVVPIWREWMAAWPTPAGLAAAPPAEVIRAWGHLGYPRRALQLRDAAEKIISDFDGEVPRTEEELLTLSGIGPYTAAAVMAFAYGERSVVLDTNIRRVLTRVLDGIALPAAHMRVAERERAEKLVPDDGPAAAEWNAAVMEFGALVCTARLPACNQCLVSECAWREAGYPDNAPKRTTQKWQGTQRQLRGAIMGALRAADEPVDAATLRERTATTQKWATPSAIEAALAGLIEDSLVEQTGERVHLPH